ncbi:MAG TPA: M56 family metallopeptidase [Verrucomicrobiae bacterium]|nr:M56 family metallopeptidase [Verrucomicrobiae bacterium]
MNSLINHLDTPVIARLGWTLAHFIWQGFGLGLLLAVAFGLRRNLSTARRYQLACATLALMALSPVVTFIALPVWSGASVDTTPFVHTVLPAVPAEAMSSPAAPTIISLLVKLAVLLDQSMPAVVLLWALGVVILAIRLAGGWWRLQRLRSEQAEPLGEPWTSRLAEMSARLGVTRPVGLLRSALMEVPTVIGWLKPMILLPGSSLTGLTPTQLDAILAHELAHIRRHDFLVNIIQRVIETVLFYHPMVWWVSRQIREERELCCDDAVLRVCPDRANYARALASLEELRASPMELVVAADGGGSLLPRIQRLLGVKTEQPGPKRWRIALLLVIGAVLAGSVECVFKPNLFPRLLSRSHTATARFVINPDPDDIKNGAGDATNPNWIATQIEIIRSGAVLMRVANEQHLAEKFRNQKGMPVPVTTEELLTFLRQRVKVEQVPGTSIIAVRYKSENPEEAAELANTIASSYCEFRMQLWRATERMKLDALEKGFEQCTMTFNDLQAQRGALLDKTDSQEYRQTFAQLELAEKERDELRQRLIQARTRRTTSEPTPIYLVDKAFPPSR